VTVSKELDAG
jgi:hypothetical protein